MPTQTVAVPFRLVSVMTLEVEVRAIADPEARHARQSICAANCYVCETMACEGCSGERRNGSLTGSRGAAAGLSPLGI